jgi:hypothetical protein
VIHFWVSGPANLKSTFSVISTKIGVGDATGFQTVPDKNALKSLQLNKADNDAGVYALLILLGGTLDISHAILHRTSLLYFYGRV